MRPCARHIRLRPDCVRIPLPSAHADNHHSIQVRSGRPVICQSRSCVKWKSELTQCRQFAFQWFFPRTSAPSFKSFSTFPTRPYCRSKIRSAGRKAKGSVSVSAGEQLQGNSRAPHLAGLVQRSHTWASLELVSYNAGAASNCAN